MPINIEIFQVSNPLRWAYRVESVYQEWDPDEPGYVPMTFERATEAAAVVAARFNNEGEG